MAKPLRALLAAMALQAALVFCYALSRVYTFNSSSVDLGAYLQVLDSILKTGIPISTFHPSSEGPFHWFGFHFTPLLYLVAIPYAIAPGIPMLMGIHTFLIAIAAIPIYFAAQHIGLSKKGAAIAAVAYLFNPFTLNAGIWGFQEPTLAAPIMAAALWAVAAKRFRWLCFFSLLLVLTKEHYGLSVAGLGAIWWWLYRDKKALLLSAAGILTMAIVILAVMPYFRGNYVNPMFVEGSEIDRYSWIFSPGHGRETLGPLAIDDIKYIFMLVACFGFLPLGGSIWFLAGAADLAIIMLASKGLFRGIGACYSLPLTPMLALAASAGFLHFKARMKNARELALLAATPAIVFGIVLSSLPLPFADNFFEFDVRPKLSLPENERKTIAEIKALLPKNAVIRAQGDAGVFFTEYTNSRIAQNIDANILWIHSYRTRSLFSLNYKDTQDYLSRVHALLQTPELKVVYWHAPWVVLAREGKEIPGARAEANETLDQFADEQGMILEQLRAVHKAN